MSAVHPEVRRYLLEAYLRPQCPTAISCIRLTLPWAEANKHPVPTHSALERLLSEFRRDNRQAVIDARTSSSFPRVRGRRGRVA